MCMYVHNILLIMNIFVLNRLHVQDILVICICVVGFGAGGILGAIGANSWSSNIVDPFNSLPPFLRALLQPFFDTFIGTRDALAATAVSRAHPIDVYTTVEPPNKGHVGAI